MSATCPVTERNRVGRLHERGRYDHDALHAILDAAMVCRIADVIDGQPYGTPTACWRGGGHLYWHGSSASRMLRAQGPGAAVCLTVTHPDALVLARCGFDFPVDYRSAPGFGTVHVIEDMERKVRALDAMVERFHPGRTRESRLSTRQEIRGTTVIGMRIEQASAKTLDGEVAGLAASASPACSPRGCRASTRE